MTYRLGVEKGCRPLDDVVVRKFLAVEIGDGEQASCHRRASSRCGVVEGVFCSESSTFIRLLPVC